MGQSFSLPRLLGMTETAVACLELLESELLLRIVRLLIRDRPEAIGALICSCKTVAQLASMSTEEGEELRTARRVVARHCLFELSELSDGRVSRIELPDVAVDGRSRVDGPCELVLTRWSRTTRPELGDHVRGTALKRVLFANQTLTLVDLSVCYLTYMDAMELGEGLKVNKTLRTLNVSGNFLGGYGRNGKFIPAPAGIATIAEALLVSKLVSLNLNENRLGPPGVKALVPGLAGTSLTSLDLSRNGLGVEGAAELAGGLLANTSLRTLDVRLNKLGPAGAKALAPGIAACRSLTALNARFNGIRQNDEGEAALKEAVKDRVSFDLMLHFVDQQEA